MLLPPDNQRIKDIIDFYCKGNELQFSKEINISQPRINRLFKIDPRSNKYPAPSYEIAQAIINKFVEINPRWLLTGEGDPNFGNLKGNPNGNLTPNLLPDSGKTKSTTLEKEKNSTSLFLPDSGKTKSTNIVELPVPVACDDEMVNIPLVDISVAAGSGFYNPDQLLEIDCIRFPKSMIKGNHIHLCVRIKGESMIPTLQDGGYLVIRLLERSEWCDVRDGHVYVVASTEGRAFVKRLKNRFHEYGFIVCMSDNPDPMGYPNFNLLENEINTIWHAEWYISAKMPNIHATYYNKVSELEDALDELREGYKGFLSLAEDMKQIRKEIKGLSKPS